MRYGMNFSLKDTIGRILILPAVILLMAPLALGGTLGAVMDPVESSPDTRSLD